MFKTIKNAGSALMAISLVAGACALATPAQAAPGMATGSVNVRTGPGVSYAKVDTLTYGESVDIEQCNAGWCFITHHGADGWVSQRYLALAAPQTPQTTPTVGISFGFGGGPIAVPHTHQQGHGKINWQKPPKLHIPGPGNN